MVRILFQILSGLRCPRLVNPYDLNRILAFAGAYAQTNPSGQTYQWRNVVCRSLFLIFDQGLKFSKSVEGLCLVSSPDTPDNIYKTGSKWDSGRAKVPCRKVFHGALAII